MTTQTLRMNEVVERVGLGRAAILKLEAEGQFPPRFDGSKALAWRESEIDAWLEEREHAARNDGTPYVPGQAAEAAIARAKSAADRLSEQLRPVFKEYQPSMDIVLHAMRSIQAWLSTGKSGIAVFGTHGDLGAAILGCDLMAIRESVDAQGWAALYHALPLIDEAIQAAGAEGKSIEEWSACHRRWRGLVELAAERKQTAAV